MVSILMITQPTRMQTRKGNRRCSHSGASVRIYGVFQLFNGMLVFSEFCFDCFGFVGGLGGVAGYPVHPPKFKYSMLKRGRLNDVLEEKSRSDCCCAVRNLFANCLYVSNCF